MKSIIVSAPGKLHLMGEHAVVYGKPAILSAVSLRLYVSIESQKSKVKGQRSSKYKRSPYCQPLWELRKKDRYLDDIVSLVEKKYDASFDKEYLTVSSTIPRGAGMGSSAALAVATIAALSKWLAKPWHIGIFNELAFQAEKKQHGNPSGGDNTIVSFGGLLWYRREFEFLKTFWSLPIQIPKNFAPFVLVHTGKPVESTREMVTAVKSKVKSQKLKVNHILSEIEVQTKQFLQSIHDENEEGMQHAIRESERLLEDLGVVSTSTQKCIRDIEKAGGVAKISGAGGRKKGSGILLCQHKNPSVITRMAKRYGYKVFQTQLGQPGVRIEQMLI